MTALRQLARGFGTAALALGVLFLMLIVAILSLVGIGIPLVSAALQAGRSVADRERRRLGLHHWALEGKFAPRELLWLLLHGTFGFLVGIFGLTLPLYALEDITFPLYYHWIPDSEGAPGIIWWTIHGLSDALLVALLGLGWLVVAVVAIPLLARIQAAPGRWLLVARLTVDPNIRIIELTKTRADALDAHAVELRRIERSLHDGTQNRLVAVNVLLGAARRAMQRDPAGADEILERAQDATEQALAELRAVVRGILPPVLDDRGLDGALNGLAAGCSVPCRLDVDIDVRCAASVEATTYFVVAEALTNVVKHSGAENVSVSVRRRFDRLHVVVEDDGHGGADETLGSGLIGIQRRVQAYDGEFSVTSPVGGPTTIRVELPCGS